MSQPIQGTLSEDRIIEQRYPFLDGSVAGEDGRSPLVTLDDDLVDVTGLNGVKPTQGEVIDDEQVRRQEFPQSFLVRVIGSGRPRNSPSILSALRNSTVLPALQAA